MIVDAKTQIVRMLRRKGPGWAFSPKDFLDLGSRNTIDVTLSKLASEGKIRRVARGVYDTPKFSKALNTELSPDIDQVAQAIARRFRWRIIPSGALAANMLGLSTQVPARVTYLSDGPSRAITVGRQTVRFKHARPKEMRIEATSSGLVIQALRHLGKVHIDAVIHKHLRRRLSPAEKRNLLRDARYSSDWIFETARKIVEKPRT